MIYLKIATLRERAGLNSLLSAFFAAFFLLSSFTGSAQQKEEADSLVRLIEANSAHLQEINGISYRKVIGPARFLHNNTYLLCDTALWNVNTNIIDAIGRVQIIQENTFLRSDRIEYIVDENLAKVRGRVVELFDKEGNILKTNYLDYNTKDSIALFYNGGAMSNKEGDIIESINGAYYSKDKLFSFYNKVNMFADSVFIVSEEIDYRTDLNKAYFRNSTTAWQEDNILYTNSGELDRPNDIFIFNKDSYILTAEQEIWADLLKYYRKSGDADLYYNIQILDTVQSVIALADKATYRPRIMTVELTLKPSVALYSEENGIKDTLFISAADTMIYFKKRYCDIDSALIAKAQERKKLSDIDPIAIAESGTGNNSTGSIKPETGPPQNGKTPSGTGGMSSGLIPDNLRKMLPDSLSVDSGAMQVAGDSLGLSGTPLQLKKDSLSVSRNLPVSGKDSSLIFAGDSLNTVRDTLLAGVSPEPLPEKDTTHINFIDAYHKVKIYRGDMQGLCDSLVYTGLDSIARFYKDPILWSEIKNQLTADSMQVVIKNNALTKANLLSNAFIISQEDSIYFNQIKSPEMTAYFSNNDLYRFDALGGVSAIFFLQEDSIITVMNQKESKMLSVKIKDRQVQKLKYIEQIKNDAHPVFGLPPDQQKLRGFDWRASERPKDRRDVTDRNIKKSRRNVIKSIPYPDYEYTGIYFPQRRDSIIAYKDFTDSLRIARARAAEEERMRKERERLMKEKDSVSSVMPADSAGIKDTSRQALNAVEADRSVSGDITPDNSVTDKKLAKREPRKVEKRLKREQKRLEKKKIRLEKKKIRQERLKSRKEKRNGPEPVSSN